MQVSSEGGQIAYPSFSLYHATKWGIEGFVEAVAQEVAPFGIDFIIAEPGPTATNFAAGLVRPAPMEVYDNTPAGAVRRAINGGSFVLKGDAARTATAMIAAADSTNPHFVSRWAAPPTIQSRRRWRSGSRRSKRSATSHSPRIVRTSDIRCGDRLTPAAGSSSLAVRCCGHMQIQA